MKTISSAVGKSWVSSIISINNIKMTAGSNTGEIGGWVPSTTDGCFPYDNTWIDPCYPQPWDQKGILPPCTGPQDYTSTGGASTFDFTKMFLITKGAGKPDLLGDFFGPGVDAIVIVDDNGGASFTPFMNKFGMIWLQGAGNSWSAYDKEKFMEFIEDDEQRFFSEQPLSKNEVLKRMAAPEEDGGK
jgi:hypothetical protein